MSEQLKIFVVEDEEKNAETVKQVFQDTVDRLKKWNLLSEMKFEEINIEWIRGEEKTTKRGKEYFFFTEDVIEKLEKKITENPDEKVGIFLDVILTKEEQERCNVNDFTRVELSRKIYDRFEARCNLYLITGLRSFGTLAWGIFGRENLKNRYIPRELVGDYPSYMAISKALYWLKNREEIPEELLKKIEEKELQE